MNPRPDSDDVADTEVDTRDVGGSPTEYPFQTNHLLWTFLGTSLAGGLYPIAVGGPLAALTLPVRAFHIIREGGLLDAFWLLFGQPLQLLAAAAFYGGIGFIVAAIGAVFALPTVLVIARTLEVRANPPWIGAVAGGTTGFIAASILWQGTIGLARFNPLPLLYLAIGPGLATILGQIGGAWGAWWAERIDRQLEAARVEDVMNSAVEGAANAGEVRRFQFGIRQMLWLCTWLAILLTVIRLIGIPLPIAAATLAGGAVYQALTLALGYFLLLPLLAKSRRRLARGGSV